MAFNPPPNKQAVELFFSLKKKRQIHPLFTSIMLKLKVENHKHLGLVLNSKLALVTHINEKILTAKKGIRIINYLSSEFLPVKTLDQMYKMFVRPHLDYCMLFIIYHHLIMALIPQSGLTR